jgi:hypothetical protein
LNPREGINFVLPFDKVHLYPELFK